MSSSNKKRNNLYEDIYRIYQDENFDYQEKYYTWYCQASNLKEAIGKAFKSEGEDNKIHGHQHRVGRKVLKEARIKALDIYENNYSETELNTFDKIYSFVDLIRRDPSISRFGELAHYDVSLRIAKYQDIRYPNSSYLPDVYLHNGTLEGAKAIFHAGDLRTSLQESNLKTGKKIKVECFPSPLNKLSGDHLENLLCIYKKELRTQKVKFHHQKRCGSLYYNSRACIKSSSSL